MKATRRVFFSKRVIAYEIIGFVFIIVFIWLDELIDLPHLLLGAELTPFNWRESLIESIVVAVLGAAIVIHTKKMLQRMKYLEGILPICASCKKIRDDKGHWHQIESYIRDKSEAEFSHGICPVCAEKLYPDFNPYKKE